MANVPVVLVGGLHAQAHGEVVQRLLAATPHSVAVHHDLRDITHGVVWRAVFDAWGARERREVRPAHDCVSCTIREDILHSLERRASDARLLILETWGSVEPAALAERIPARPGIHSRRAHRRRRGRPADRHQLTGPGARHRPATARRAERRWDPDRADDRLPGGAFIAR